jgi:hypothetical protein
MTPLDKAREALAAVERVAQMLYVAKGAATLFGPWGAQLYPNVKEPFLRQARTELAPLLAEHERLADRVAKLEGALWNTTALIGHALPDMKASALVAGERLIAKDVWQAARALLTPTEGAEDGR